MTIQMVILFLSLVTSVAIPYIVFEYKRKQRIDYYRNVYLKSDDWKRKRYVVLKRDNWRCVYCGAPATQVHHMRYAKKNIGKEPIKWLVSVCHTCHETQHGTTKAKHLRLNRMKF
jgi:5-methylcytosine-specific restriction endonuclease McrA